MDTKLSRTTLSRRHLIEASLVAGGLAATPLSLAAAVKIATPPQTRGPFYPVKKPLDQDNDLIHVAGRNDRAEGKPIHVTGRLFGGDGRPVSGATVEIWQANAFGRYHHPRDHRDVPLDPNFQGYGRNLTDDGGGWRFLTILPPPYPASATWTRPAHIHFAISGPGFERLVTQMYFAGDPWLKSDSIFNEIRDPAARASVVVNLAPPPPELAPAAEIAIFDIVLG